MNEWFFGTNFLKNDSFLLFKRFFWNKHLKIDSFFILNEQFIELTIVRFTTLPKAFNIYLINDVEDIDVFLACKLLNRTFSAIVSAAEIRKLLV